MDELILEEDLLDIKNVVRKVNILATITDNHVFVKQSTIPNAGFGLFARKNIKEGALITEYGGRMITAQEIGNRDYIYEFPEKLVRIIRDSPGISREEKVKIDASIRRYKGTVLDARTNFRLSEMGRWINSDPLQQNVVLIFLGEKNGEWKIGFEAIREIKKGEEIFVDYGKKYWTNCRICGIQTNLMCSETKIPFCSKRCQKKHWSEK